MPSKHIDTVNVSFLQRWFSGMWRCVVGRALPDICTKHLETQSGPNIKAKFRETEFCCIKVTQNRINPFNAELNPICHLLVLLGDLTFMGPCIISIFQHISNKMQRYTVYLYPETALHVSSVTSTHHLEGIQQYLQHLVFVTPLLLPAAIAG